MRASVALSFLLSVNAASAATDIQGTLEDLRLNVENATIIEILNALSTRFKFTYKVLAQNDRPVTGLYSGSVRETLKRVLDGNDYVLGSSDSGLKILILGASNISGTPPLQPASKVTSAPASSRPAGMVSVNPSLSTASPPPLSSYVSQNGSVASAVVASSP